MSNRNEPIFLGILTYVACQIRPRATRTCSSTRSSGPFFLSSRPKQAAFSCAQSVRARPVVRMDRGNIAASPRSMRLWHLPLLHLSEKHRRRNVKPFAQFLDLRFINLTLPMQDLGNDAFRPKDGRRIFLTKVMDIH